MSDTAQCERIFDDLVNTGWKSSGISRGVRASRPTHRAEAMSKIVVELTKCGVKLDLKKSNRREDPP